MTNLGKESPVYEFTFVKQSTPVLRARVCARTLDRCRRSDVVLCVYRTRCTEI